MRQRGVDSLTTGIKNEAIELITPPVVDDAPPHQDLLSVTSTLMSMSSEDEMFSVGDSVVHLPEPESAEISCTVRRRSSFDQVDLNLSPKPQSQTARGFRGDRIPTPSPHQSPRARQSEHKVSTVWTGRLRPANREEK